MLSLFGLFLLRYAQRGVSVCPHNNGVSAGRCHVIFCQPPNNRPISLTISDT